MGKTRFHQADDRERLRIVEAIKEALGRHHEILFAFLYGSFASEQLFRDIDVGLFVEESQADLLRSFAYESRLSEELEEAAHAGFPVEVKVINDAPIPFCFQVIRGELLFCRSEEELTRFMTSVSRRYLDFAPLRSRYLLEAMT